MGLGTTIRPTIRLPATSEICSIPLQGIPDTRRNVCFALLFCLRLFTRVGRQSTTGVDDGLSRTWALYWAATRPNCVTYCDHDAVGHFLFYMPPLSARHCLKLLHGHAMTSERPTSGLCVCQYPSIPHEIFWTWKGSMLVMFLCYLVMHVCLSSLGTVNCEPRRATIGTMFFVCWLLPLRGRVRLCEMYA